MLRGLKKKISLLLVAISFGLAVGPAYADNRPVEFDLMLSGFKRGSSSLSSLHNQDLTIAGLQNSFATKALCTAYAPKKPNRTLRSVTSKRALEACKALNQHISGLTYKSEIIETSDRKLHDKVRVRISTPPGAQTFKNPSKVIPVNPGDRIVQWGEVVKIHPDLSIALTNPEISRVTEFDYSFEFISTTVTELIPRVSQGVRVGNLSLVFEDGTRHNLNSCTPNCEKSFTILNAEMRRDPMNFKEAHGTDQIEHPKRVSYILLEPNSDLRSKGMTNVRWDIPDPKSIFKTTSEDSYVGSDRVAKCTVRQTQSEITLTLDNYLSQLVNLRVTGRYQPWIPNSPTRNLNLGTLKSGSTTLRMGATQDLQRGFMTISVGDMTFCQFHIYHDVVAW